MKPIITGLCTYGHLVCALSVPSSGHLRISSCCHAAFAIALVMASVLAPAAVRAPASVRASLLSRRARVAATRPAHLAPRRVAPTASRGAADAFILAQDSSRAVAPRSTARASASSPASPPPGPRSLLAPLGLRAAVAAAVAQLCLLPGSALAEVDADGVPPPNILTTIGFTLAVALLAVITLGVLYLSAREALDKQEEQKAREEDERAERVLAANKGRVPGMGPAGGKRKKKKSTPLAQVGDLGPNRRERRRMARDGENADDTSDDEEDA